MIYFRDLCVKESSKIQVYEGAENNLPDENAHTAAMAIEHLVQNLGEDDILIVLISGNKKLWLITHTLIIINVMTFSWFFVCLRFYTILNTFGHISVVGQPNWLPVISSYFASDQLQILYLLNKILIPYSVV